MKDILYSILELLLDLLAALFRLAKKFFTPKRVVKIIIIFLIYKFVVYLIDLKKVHEYKDRAETFISMLEEDKPYQAQSMLGKKIQKMISVEQLKRLIQVNKLTGLDEIEWIDWKRKKGVYLLNGKITFEDGRETIPVSIIMSGKKDEAIKILEILIGDEKIKAKESKYLL